MIHIANFETEFVAKGRKFKTQNGIEYLILGYGDNGSNGNPYFIGVDSTGKVRTERFKDIELIP